MTTDFTFTTPQQLLQHLATRHMIANIVRGELVSWSRQATVWYNTNICKCKKKGMSEDIIIQGYKKIISYSDIERINALRVIGGSATFIWNEELLGTIS